MNIFAFSTPRASDWRWRIVDFEGETLEESSASFPTIAEAVAAGTERLQLRRNRDRQLPSRVPWRRRH